MQALCGSDTKKYDRIDIVLKNGEKKSIFFDITKPFENTYKNLFWDQKKIDWNSYNIEK